MRAKLFIQSLDWQKRHWISLQRGQMCYWRCHPSLLSHLVCVITSPTHHTTMTSTHRDAEWRVYFTSLFFLLKKILQTAKGQIKKSCIMICSQWEQSWFRCSQKTLIVSHIFSSGSALISELPVQQRTEDVGDGYTQLFIRLFLKTLVKQVRDPPQSVGDWFMKTPFYKFFFF